MTAADRPAYGGGRQVRGSSFWSGPFREGNGTISTASETLTDEPYTYASRFEGAEGASPEELLAAAHAACFNHAVANIAQVRGLQVQSVTTSASLTMGRDESGPAILGVHLDTKAKVSEATKAHFQDLAERARTGCALSKALNVEITLTAECETV
jgi:osmotically inducible protein OsmC